MFAELKQFWRQGSHCICPCIMRSTPRTCVSEALTAFARCGWSGGTNICIYLFLCPSSLCTSLVHHYELNARYLSLCIYHIYQYVWLYLSLSPSFPVSSDINANRDGTFEGKWCFWNLSWAIFQSILIFQHHCMKTKRCSSLNWTHKKGGQKTINKRKRLDILVSAATYK